MENQLHYQTHTLLRMLQQATQECSTVTDSLCRLAQTAQRFFEADACTLFGKDPDNEQLIPLLTLPDSLELDEQELVSETFRHSLVLIENVAEKYKVHTFNSVALVTLHPKHTHEPLGIVCFYFTKRLQFDSDYRQLFEFYETESSFLLSEMQRQQRYQTLFHINQEICQDITTIETLFIKVQQYIPALFEKQSSLVLAYHQHQTNDLDIYTHGDEGGVCFLPHVPLQGACHSVMTTQQPLLIKRLSVMKEEQYLPPPELVEADASESFMYVPLFLRETFLGVLVLHTSQPDTYTYDDLCVLEMLASHFVLALQSILLYTNLQLLNETGQFISQQVEVQQTLQTILQKVKDVSNADFVILSLYDQALQHITMISYKAGAFLHTTSSESSFSSFRDLALQAMTHTHALFVKESASFISERSDDTGYKLFIEQERIHSLIILPLYLEKRALGVLFVAFRQPQQFTSPERLLISGLAHHTVTAILTTEKFSAFYQRRLFELEVIQRIDKELNQTLELEALCATFLNIVLQHTKANEAALYLTDTSNTILHLVTTATQNTVAGESRETHPRLWDDSIQLLEYQHPTSMDKSKGTVPEAKDVPLEQSLFRSELAIPLLDGDEILGVLNLGSMEENAFEPETEQFLTTLVGQSTLAIKKAQAYDREKRLVVEGQILNQIIKELTSEQGSHRIFELILEKALSISRSSTGYLMLYDASRNELWMAAERGVAPTKKGHSFRLEEGIVGHAARTQQLLNVDPSVPPWNMLFLDYIPGTRSVLAVPMLQGTTLRGVLNIESTTPGNFTTSDERLLLGLADLAVIALQNTERYESATSSAQRFELLYRAGQELGQITEQFQLDQAYAMIVQIAHQQTQGNIHLYRYDEEVQRNVLVCSSSQSSIITDLEEREDQKSSQSPSLILPISFKERYYGSFMVSFPEAISSRDADKDLFEGLVQQLANTIYRLEIIQARQELEQRALSAEEMASIGQSAFELTHRLGNDLGLVPSHVGDIIDELQKEHVENHFINSKLQKIVTSVRRVLTLSKALKQELTSDGRAEGARDQIQSLSPTRLLQEAISTITLPTTIQIDIEVEEQSDAVIVYPPVVLNILRNVIINAVEAMPGGGQIILRAHNVGRAVAFDVIDTGHGILPQIVPKIFDLFYSTKGSSGFGLWSARRLALRNRGDIKVKSIPGEGTTVTILLPRYDKEREEELRSQDSVEMKEGEL